MLKLHDIHTYYGNIQALKGISLHVDQGEIVTLIGSNGAGKSTTLRTISGLTPPRQGQVIFEDEEISHIPAHKLVSRGISQSPEGRHIFPNLTVRDNLLMGAYTRNDKAGINEDMENAFNLFPRLRERASQRGGTLSGGEQQMLAIGRALMSRPRLLLLDEPSMGLAPVLVDQIFEIIQNINKQGTTILLVEQNALMALSIANRGYVLQTGEIVLADDAAALSNNEMVQKAYLGIE